ncbi:hypothetical protein JNB11_01085 [Kocuria palustris]|nr:hypothetical protein [Kocuria palustris]
MLQLKQISKVLTQGLQEVPAGYESTVLERLPLGISLLSPEGHPLATVTNELALKQAEISADSLRVHGLIGYQHMEQHPDQLWALCEIDPRLQLMVSRVATAQPRYLVVYYHSGFPRAAAKLKLDNMTQVLAKGLEGY